MIFQTWPIFSAVLGMAGTLVSASPVTRDVADGVLGGYLNSCRNIKGFYLWGDQGSVTDLWISGECMDIGGNYVKSQMDVNPCYKNINEQIVPVTDGSGDIAHSCDYCQLFPDWTSGWMSCMCYLGGAGAVDSGYFVSNVDLHRTIWVNNGILGCPGAEGRAGGP